MVRSCLKKRKKTLLPGNYMLHQMDSLNRIIRHSHTWSPGNGCCSRYYPRPCPRPVLESWICTEQAWNHCNWGGLISKHEERLTEHRLCLNQKFMWVYKFALPLAVEEWSPESSMAVWVFCLPVCMCIMKFRDNRAPDFLPSFGIKPCLSHQQILIPWILFHAT